MSAARQAGSGPVNGVPYRATGTEAGVCADIALRQAHGIRKYGVAVAENPLALREWLQHAYEEALDFAVYLKRSIDELDRTTTRPPERRTTQEQQR